MTEHLDGLDALAERLNFKRLGWHRHVNEETGDVALFPNTAKDVDAWERRATAQAAESERLEMTTRPDPKAEVNTLAERVVRGD